MEQSALQVKYWILKQGKPFRSFATKEDRSLYLKTRRIRIGKARRFSLKDIVRFTMAQ